MTETILTQFITDNLPKGHTVTLRQHPDHNAYSIYCCRTYTAEIHQQDTTIKGWSLSSGYPTLYTELTDPNSIATLEQWLQNLNK